MRRGEGGGTRGKERERDGMGRREMINNTIQKGEDHGEGERRDM